MSYVASPEEVAVFEDFSSQPKFSQEAITCDFTTTKEFVQSVLPPHFKPAAEPTGHIYVGTMESRLCGEFDCALISLDVIFNGKPGIYMLEMLISEDFPVTWGREIWGETKKTAFVKMQRSGNYRYAFAERNGVRLIEIEGEFGDELPPTTTESRNFEIKAYPGSRGKGVQWEPVVNELHVVEHHTRQSKGQGIVTLRGNRNNPIHSIPVLSITDLQYTSGLAEYTVINEYPLGVTKEYLPYLIGRHYDDMRTFKVGNQWTGLDPSAKHEETFPVQRLTTPGFNPSKL